MNRRVINSMIEYFRTPVDRRPARLPLWWRLLGYGTPTRHAAIVVAPVAGDER